VQQRCIGFNYNIFHVSCSTYYILPCSINSLFATTTFYYFPASPAAQQFNAPSLESCVVHFCQIIGPFCRIKKPLAASAAAAFAVVAVAAAAAAAAAMNDKLWPDVGGNGLDARCNFTS
jgi:hypothetical protein